MVGRQFLLDNKDLIGYTQNLVADKSLDLENLSSDSRMIGSSLRISLNVTSSWLQVVKKWDAKHDLEWDKG